MGIFRRLFRREPERHVDPNTAHTFRSIDDPGLAAAFIRSAGSKGGRPLGTDMAVTGRFMQNARCGVPGCGRDRDDAIHFPEG